MQLSEGDQAAFGVLTQRYGVRLANFAAKVLGNPIQAEDVVQEIFIKLWQRPQLFDAEKAQFKTWIHRVTLNRCLDEKRRKTGTPLNDLAEEPQSPEPSQEDTLLNEDRDRAVQRAIETLPERQRAALALCYLDDLSNREAADILELNIKALESLLTRARANLKQALTPMKEHLV